MAVHDLYGGTIRLLEEVFRPWDLEVVYAEGPSVGSYMQSVSVLARPRLMWLETPTNPLLDILDIRTLSQLAKSRGMTVVVDNTFASPFLQKPLLLRADMVVHSTTKYLGGHSDAVGGPLSPGKRKSSTQSVSFKTRLEVSPAPWTATLFCAG